MKSVAISQRSDWVEKRNEVRDALDQRLVDLLICVDFLPYPVPNTPKFSKTENTLEWLKNLSPNAILLSGGNDLAEFTSRDQTESTLINYAISKCLPILGICRGMQMLGSYFGASLEKLSGHAGTRHALITNEEYAKHFSKTVNSYHNFCLKDFPKEIEIIATDAEGSCEAFRHKRLPIEAWMWHPERQNPFEEKDLLNMKRVLTHD